MRITLSVIKADIGSVGGHLKPSRQLLEGAQAFVDNNGRGLLDDFYISHTGDDIALLFIHQKGPRNEDIHKLAWDAFSGTLVGMGPAVAEMEIVERPSEPFLFFAADKSDPGAYNLPLFLAFADPHVLSRPYVEPKDGQGLQVQYHGC
jgi:fructose 1,6-bisphosphate aldolase/phosphatase